WYAAAPVCVVEKLSPLESLKRSAELTQGNRWKIFGFYVVLMIVGAVIGGVIGGLSAVILPAVIGAVILFLFTAIWSAFVSVVNVVVYHDLRVVKEGVDIESIASVFD